MSKESNIIILVYYKYITSDYDIMRLIMETASKTTYSSTPVGKNSNMTVYVVGRCENEIGV